MQYTLCTFACSFVHNILLLHVAQFVSKHKRKGLRTCSIDMPGKDLIKVEMHIAQIFIIGG